MHRVKSWWHLKKVRHRDAIILSVVSAAFLLAGEIQDSDLGGVYTTYLAPVAGQPLQFLFNFFLVVIAFTTYFGGILVLLGGLHFSWDRIERGRFLVSLGTGISFLVLIKQAALFTLLQGSPLLLLITLTTTLTGIGILLGFVTHTLMHEYALMLKQHARTMWRRWRRARRPKPRYVQRNSRRRTSRS